MHQRGQQQLLHKQAAVGALALQELPLRFGHLGLVQPERGGTVGGVRGVSQAGGQYVRVVFFVCFIYSFNFFQIFIFLLNILFLFFYSYSEWAYLH